MSRQKLAAFATSAALILLAVILFGGVLAVGDRVFQWDVVPDEWEVEPLLRFCLLSAFVAWAACVSVSVMLNLSIIAEKLSQAVARAGIAPVAPETRSRMDDGWQAPRSEKRDSTNGPSY